MALVTRTHKAILSVKFRINTASRCVNIGFPGPAETEMECTVENEREDVLSGEPWNVEDSVLGVADNRARL